MKTSRPVDARLERLEKTQTYNLSLEASAHDLYWQLCRARGAGRPHSQGGQRSAKEEG